MISAHCPIPPSGPDGVGDYSVHIEEQRYIGHGTMSPEGTADVQYLCRAAKVCVRVCAWVCACVNVCVHRVFITTHEKNDKIAVAEKLHIYLMFSSKYE